MVDDPNATRHLLREKGIEYFRKCIANFDTWAEAKKSFSIPIEEVCSLLDLKVNEGKEIWRDELKRGKEAEKWREQEIKNRNRKPVDFLTTIINAFLDKYPHYFDRNKILWRWNHNEYLWERVDEFDLALSVKDAREQNDIWIERKFIGLILEQARLREPKQPKETWVQFKGKIYDFANGDILDATPEYFITNPINWEVGESIETPTIDLLLTQWVGEECVRTMYEVIAYCITQNKFLQRIVALTGGGSNGKGTFVKGILFRFLGKGNYCSSELKLLSERNFETSILHKKLLCELGEVGYDDLTNTAQLKRLSGEDEIRFEYKGKQPFSAPNTATIICQTNSLPQTPDKSLGFYRRWLIIDFPNVFSIGKDPTLSIPDKEFENLARKSLEILKELWQSRKFSNEGDYVEREKAYEQKSNPILIFIEMFCEDTPAKHTPKQEFWSKFNVWLKETHQRPLSPNQFTRMLKRNGYEIGSRKIDEESIQVVINLTLSNEKFAQFTKKEKTTTVTIDTAKFLLNFPIRETKLEKRSNNGNLGNPYAITPTVEDWKAIFRGDKDE